MGAGTAVAVTVIWLVGFLAVACWHELRGEACIWCGEDLHKGYCRHVRNKPPTDGDEGDE